MALVFCLAFFVVHSRQMGKSNIILGTGILAVAFLLVWKPEAGWNVRRYFSGYRGDETGTEADLRAENAKLKTELAALESLSRDLPRNTPGSIPAFVYAHDPLNFTDEILVSAGTAEGASLDAPVAARGILFGKVTAIYPEKSLVRTIFDSRWRSAVRIGTKGVEALFQGGNQPTVVLIKKDAEIREGDAVFNIAEHFPYGITLGTITNIRESGDALFKEADVEIPYRVGDVEIVDILK